MARTSIETLLPLQTWGELVGISPWDLAQMRTPNDGSQCPHVFFQHPWQGSYLSRDEVARAIARAEQMIAEELGYWPAPVWRSEQLLEDRRYGFRLPYGRFLGAGTLRYEPLASGVPVSFEDRDGDGVAETFLLRHETTLTDTSEIGVFYTEDERDGEGVSEVWRVRPVKTKLEGGVFQAWGFKGLLVRRDKLEGPNVTELDHDDETVLAEKVDLYRVYLDQSFTQENPAQGTANYPPMHISQSWDLAPISVISRQGDQGLVSLLIAAAPPRSTRPAHYTVHYLSGVPLVNGRMERRYAEIVAMLATALLPVTSTGCERADAIIDYWRAQPSDGEDGRPLTQKEVDNCAFGVTRGGLYAWGRVTRLKEVLAIGV